MFALGGTSIAENSLYDESGAAYRQMVPKELKHDTARRSGNICDGCKWNGKRYPKCSCCRRNRNMKDNYKEENHG